ncbi:MAG: hypothetical protein V4666_08425 [Bacteroidota bacterium]
MAKFELKFKDVVDSSTIEVNSLRLTDPFEEVISIQLFDCISSETNIIYLDKSTAIKFAKTLRTEINKITESEVSNG